MTRQRKRKGQPVTGWLNLRKPLNMTSTQAVGKARRLFNARKAGHGGTLDPLADGVLPIAFGEATKTAQWAMDCDKEYVFTLAWGRSTTTLDGEGETLSTHPHRPDRLSIEQALQGFIGRISQIPPKYSAIKVDGERAYDLARHGEDFELKARQVDVYEAELIDLPDPNHAVIRIVSGKGFYVRAMARDLALALSTAGHVSQLRRTRVGPLEFDEAVSFETLERLSTADQDRAALMAHLQPLHSVLDDIPQIQIGPDQARDLRLGREIVLLPHIIEDWRAQQAELEAERLALSLCQDEAVALGEVRAGRFHPQRVFQTES